MAKGQSNITDLLRELSRIATRMKSLEAELSKALTELKELLDREEEIENELAALDD